MSATNAADAIHSQYDSILILDFGSQVCIVCKHGLLIVSDNVLSDVPAYSIAI